MAKHIVSVHEPEAPEDIAENPFTPVPAPPGWEQPPGPLADDAPRVYTEVDITPDIAEFLLANMVYTRDPKAENIRAYSWDMKKNRWVMNGQGLQFAWDPDYGIWRMVNGQNRMRAMILSGRESVRFTLVWGVPWLSWYTMDSPGSGRGLADQLSVAGSRSFSVRQSVMTRRIMSWEEGDYTGRRHFRVNMLDQLAFAEEHRGEFLPVLNRDGFDNTSVRLIAVCSQLAVTRVILRRIDKEFADAFLDDLVWQTSGHPLMGLARRRLVRIRQGAEAVTDITQGVPRSEVARALMFHVWNKFVTGDLSQTRIQLPDLNKYYPVPKNLSDDWETRRKTVFDIPAPANHQEEGE